jgi:hypothetical protein
MVKVADFGAAFDDDSHTLSDGAIERFFRMRKWFLVVAFLLMLFKRNWIQFEAIAAALHMEGIPSSLIYGSLTLLGIYFMVQGVLVLLQILFVYPRNLTLRVQILRSDMYRALALQLGELLRRRAASDATTRLDEEIGRVRDSLRRVGRANLPSLALVGLAEISLDAVRIFPTLFFLGFAVYNYGDLAQFLKFFAVN